MAACLVRLRFRSRRILATAWPLSRTVSSETSAIEIVSNHQACPQSVENAQQLADLQAILLPLFGGDQTHPGSARCCTSAYGRTEPDRRENASQGDVQNLADPQEVANPTSLSYPQITGDGFPPAPAEGTINGMERARFAAWAAAVDGVATRAELLAAGASSTTIANRVRDGEWQRPFPAVFLLFPGTPSWEQRLACVQKWAGSQAVFSHRTAAYLHGLRSHAPEVLDITVPQASGLRSTARCTIHRPLVTATRTGSPSRTSLGQTVVDLVGHAHSEAEALDLLINAIQKRMNPAAFLTQLVRYPRMKNRGFVLRLLEVTAEGVESQLEPRVPATCRTRPWTTARGAPEMGTRPQPLDPLRLLVPRLPGADRTRRGTRPPRPRYRRRHHARQRPPRRPR